MSRLAIVAGLSIAAIGPAIVVVGALVSAASPGCTWAFSAPAGGCEIGNVSLNWFMDLVTLAFAGSFFLVPLGGLVLAGGFLSLLVRNARPEPAGIELLGHQRPFGLYNSNGEQLSEAEVLKAIAGSERGQLEDILRSFGRSPGSALEPIERLRSRCLDVLNAAQHRVA